MTMVSEREAPTVSFLNSLTLQGIAKKTKLCAKPVLIRYFTRCLAFGTILSFFLNISWRTIEIANKVDKSTRMYQNSNSPILEMKARGNQHSTIDSTIPTPWLVQEGGNKQDRYRSSAVTLQTANQATFSMPDEKDWLLSQPYYNSKVYFDKNNQLIPKILHKVVFATTGGFPENFAEIIDSNRSIAKPPVKGSLTHAHFSWGKLNPEYEIRYYNLYLARSYLKQFYHPIFLRAFDCIEAFAGKTNLFRYIVVYREGGFYSDWKQECKVDGLLNWLSSNSTTWFSAFDRPGHSNRMQNAFFGAPPKSPILAEAIRTSLHNLQSRADLKDGADVLDTSGVGILGKSFFDVGKHLGWKLPVGKQRNQKWDCIPGVRLGDFKYTWGQRFFYNGTTIVIHKCDDCGKDQNWTTGNNYNEKFAIGEYYCPDAPSVFLPKEKDNQTQIKVDQN